MRCVGISVLQRRMDNKAGYGRLVLTAEIELNSNLDVQGSQGGPGAYLILESLIGHDKTGIDWSYKSMLPWSVMTGIRKQSEGAAWTERPDDGPESILRLHIEDEMFIRTCELDMEGGEHWGTMAEGIHALINAHGTRNDLGPGAGRYEWKPIHLAAMHGNIVAMDLLIKKGARIDDTATGCCDCWLPHHVGGGVHTMYRPGEPNEERPKIVWHMQFTPLHIAICSRQPKAAMWLIENGASIYTGKVKVPLSRHRGLDRGEGTALHDAAAAGNTDLLRYILENLPRQDVIKMVNHTCPGGYTPLDRAVAAGHGMDIAPILEIWGARLCVGGAQITDTVTMSCLDGRTAEASMMIKSKLLFLDLGEEEQKRIGDSALRAICCRDRRQRFIEKRGILRSLLMIKRYRKPKSMGQAGCELVNIEDELKPPDKEEVLRLCTKLLKHADQMPQTRKRWTSPWRKSKAQRLHSLTPMGHAISSHFAEMVSLLMVQGMAPPLTSYDENGEPVPEAMNLALDESVYEGDLKSNADQLTRTINTLAREYQKLDASTLEKMMPSMFAAAAKLDRKVNLQAMRAMEIIKPMKALPAEELVRLFANISNPLDYGRPAMDYITNNLVEKFRAAPDVESRRRDVQTVEMAVRSRPVGSDEAWDYMAVILSRLLDQSK